MPIPCTVFPRTHTFTHAPTRTLSGGGIYSFIPDSGFVGTVFVHALANTLVTVASQCTLKLEVGDGGSGSAESGMVIFDAGKTISTNS